MEMKLANFFKRMKRPLCSFLCVLLSLLAVVPFLSSTRSDAAFDEGLNYRVGLAFGSGVKKIFDVSAPRGITVGLQSLTDGEKSFQPLFDYESAGTYRAACDGYDPYGNENYGYNVECTAEFATYGEANELLSEFCDSVGDVVSMIFIAYVDGAYRVHFGNFATYSEANDCKNALYDCVSGYWFETHGLSDETVTVMDSVGWILFEFNSSDPGLTVAFRSLGGNLSYGNKERFGTLAFSRYVTSRYNGIQLVNVLPIERYVMCCMMQEIYTSWPEETLKAFAVTARSYALSYLNSYSSYNFDINTSAQGFGTANVASSVEKAVRDTSGLVVAYDDYGAMRVCRAYYTSSLGGGSAAPEDVWSSSVPYLRATKTPWERYTSISTGFWGKDGSVTLTGEQVLSKVNSKYRGALGGTKVTDITVNSRASGSDYVKSITFYDNYGYSYTVTGCDNIRICLGLKSANFAVGKGSCSYSYEDVITVGDGETYSKFNFVNYLVRSGLGLLRGGYTGDESVITSRGTFGIGSSGGSVITGKDSSNSRKVFETESHTGTAISSDPSAFVFVGKGWGHGVGLSQYGIRDLGNLGYKYDDMIYSYYNDVSIVDYSSLGIG